MSAVAVATGTPQARVTATDAVPDSSPGTMPGEVGGSNADPRENTAPAAQSTTAGASEVALVRARTALIVPGARLPGRLDVADGCIVVTVDGVRRTAVFPPEAAIVRENGQAVAVTYPGRRLAIGADIGIPGGGATSRSDLAAPPPAGCPTGFYAIGG